MYAKTVMNTVVVAVLPSTTVKQIAKILYEHRISAVPVIDKQERLVGIVSEGDLVFREELGTKSKQSWWLSFFEDTERRAHDYVKSHSTIARDIMTTKVISVTEETSVQQIAELLERHQIKRVPVLRDSKVVGIVSRANLVQSLAVGANKSESTDNTSSDLAIREELDKTLRSELGISMTPLNIIVKKGIVHIWGFVDGEQERRAIQIVAEGIEGVTQVDSRLILYSTIPAYGI